MLEEYNYKTLFKTCVQLCIINYTFLDIKIQIDVYSLGVFTHMEIENKDNLKILFWANRYI